MPTVQQMANTKRQRAASLATCIKCREEKPWTDFEASPSRRPFGLASNCKPCDRARKAGQKRSKWWKLPEASREKARDKNLKMKFGISAKDYDLLFEKQEGRCALCGELETYIHHSTRKPARLAVDHCHSKGHVRALLCANCNKGLGCFKDDPVKLLNAINYLEKHR